VISLLEGKGPRKRKVPDRVFQLHLRVASCRPPIWRRMLVRESMWLSRLHDAIQVLFEWFDYQTHEFASGERRYGNPAKREDLVVEDDRDATLADLGLDAQGRLTYRYHFDDGWQVDLLVEKVLPPKPGVRYPVCAGGSRAGPPEDCGGPEAYHDMLGCLKEPDSDLGKEWIEWLGPDYEPEGFDLERINRALRKLGK
jgi:Plasmid pRiA4b ORF-3-like protein